MILLAFDPSLTATGFAVLQDGPRVNTGQHDPYGESGELLQAGRIVPDGESRDYPTRIASVFREVRALLDEYEPSVVAVELPSRYVPSQGRGMQRAGQPIYGSAVGAVISAASCPLRLADRRRITPPRIIAYAADEWTRALRPDIRRTRDDKNKTRRVAEAARIYGRNVEDFGAMSNAGDVADAVLLAYVTLHRLKSDEQRNLWRASNG